MAEELRQMHQEILLLRPIDAPHEGFCISCDWTGPIHLMSLTDGGFLCEECEVESTLKYEVRGATLKQSITALPAGAPALAILAHAVFYGINAELFLLGGVAGGLAILHALYSLDAFLTQERLPLRDRLGYAERYEPLGVAGVMGLLGAGGGMVHLLGFWL